MIFTTAFSTRCWRSVSVLLLLISWLPLNAAPVEGISIKSASIELTEEGYQLAASFEVGFTQTIQDAVNRGISLPFILEYEITRPRWYWLDATVAAGSRSRQIAYNALTRQYRLTIGSLYQDFERLEDVKQVLSSIRGVDVVERDQLVNGVTYDVAVRLRLDVSRLPKPFQVNALSSREWTLSSDWHRFTYTP